MLDFFDHIYVGFFVKNKTQDFIRNNMLELKINNKKHQLDVGQILLFCGY
tara:strand:- start:501 stop:650 length:150 start_codon:yes stop_codon:yes gene_type:complete